MSISQIRPVYKYNINKYNKVLFQRNNLLKSNKPKPNIINLIEVFDLQLAKLGTDIMISRLKFIEKLSRIAKGIHEKLTLEEELTINYDTNVNLFSKDKNIIEKNFFEQLRKM